MSYSFVENIFELSDPRKRGKQRTQGEGLFDNLIFQQL